MELLQFAVLGFTGLLWWLARRDLSQRAAQIRAGESEEMGRLRAGVESLVADLERRAEAAEARLSARIAQAQSLPASTPGMPMAEDEDRYAPVMALREAGITDPTEIARRTGLGRGEVELLLTLRGRQAR